MVLRKRTKKLLLIALVAITLVWFVALYLHIQGYNRYFAYMHDTGQWLWYSREVPTIVRLLEYAWPNGFFLIQATLIICVAWIYVIISTLRHMLKINKHNDN